jgi:hypothetical protein
MHSRCPLWAQSRPHNCSVIKFLSPFLLFRFRARFLLISRTKIIINRKNVDTKTRGNRVPATKLGDGRSLWVKDSIRVLMRDSDLRIFIIFFLGSMMPTSRACGSCSKSVQRCVAYSKTIVDLCARGLGKFFS